MLTCLDLLTDYMIGSSHFQFVKTDNRTEKEVTCNISDDTANHTSFNISWDIYFCPIHWPGNCSTRLAVAPELGINFLVSLARVEQS